MDIPQELKTLFSYIDSKKDHFIDNLREAVAIPSVSAWPENRGDIVKMINWTAKKLEELGTEVEICDVNELVRIISNITDMKHQAKNESDVKIPPVLLGILGKDKNKKTVCVYGHLDVQPARKEDGWNTEPFVLTEKDGRLYGRGATDDKGPVLGWIHALQAYKNTKQEFPVNLKSQMLLGLLELLRNNSPKMDIPQELKTLFSYIDSKKDHFIDNLREAVAIPSVSAWPENRGDIVKMINWTAKKLEELGTEVEICDVNELVRIISNITDMKHQAKNESDVKIPPVLLGILGKDKNKKTVCVYGHLDVQPARKEDGWNTEPFVLTEKDGRLYGRGATDDKGPVLGWIHALQAYKNTKQEFPVNLKVGLIVIAYYLLFCGLYS
ncbi:hypothetical protein J437_LFUL018803 [Ladona fulva]|uniref:Cytosolic non-specific dipeptidase n=1 Tax=Ladona fulva TaxID=123851 RepID=A0A8K0P9M1_LADFU|nr:hypothetical protein J437_LFUL018803 [Ladona fulva]